MALTLVELQGHLAATSVGGVVEGGTYFLDFSRPLDVRRRFGIMAEAVFAPVIHKEQREGGYVIGVHRIEPCSEQLRALWKQRYPSPARAPA